MTNEKKTILIGTLITIFLLALAILIFYLIYNTSKDNNTVNNNTINENNNASENNLEESGTAEEKDPIENNENANDDQTSPNETEDQTNKENNEEEKTVTIYLFRGEGCPHCEHAMEFFKTLNTEYPYLKVISYEVWENVENRKLMEEVSTKLGIEVSITVPLIIIGNDYNLRGYGETKNEEIRNQIEESYQNNNYEDIVEKVLENSSYNVTSEEII